MIVSQVEHISVQTQECGSSITPGSTLTITISKGPAGGSTTPPVNNNPTTPEDMPDNGRFRRFRTSNISSII